MRKFMHDCKHCEYLGHFFDHDVYLCPGVLLSETVIARYGDDRPDYASFPTSVLKDSIRANGQISGYPGWQMAYQDYVFSDKCIKSTRAMILGLVMRAQ